MCADGDSIRSRFEAIRRLEMQNKKLAVAP